MTKCIELKTVTSVLSFREHFQLCKIECYMSCYPQWRGNHCTCPFCGLTRKIDNSTGQHQAYYCQMLFLYSSKNGVVTEYVSTRNVQSLVAVKPWVFIWIQWTVCTSTNPFSEEIKVLLYNFSLKSNSSVNIFIAFYHDNTTIKDCSCTNNFHICPYFEVSSGLMILIYIFY